VTVPGGGQGGNRKAIGSLLREHLGAGSRGVASFAGSALVESGFGEILLMVGRTFPVRLPHAFPRRTLRAYALHS